MGVEESARSKTRIRSLSSPTFDYLDDADLLSIYAYPASLDAPWVRANMVASIDGSPTIGGKSNTLTSSADRRLFHLLRAESDVILIGAGTARSEPYSNHRKQLAVVTRSGDLPPKLFTGIPPIVVTTEALAFEKRRELEARAEVIACGRHEIDFAVMLDAFCERGWLRVLCEGGPGLLGSMYAAGSINEIALTTTPKAIGGGTSWLQGSQERERTLELASLLESQGNLFARYLVL